MVEVAAAISLMIGVVIGYGIVEVVEHLNWKKRQREEHKRFCEVLKSITDRNI